MDQTLNAEPVGCNIQRGFLKLQVKQSTYVEELDFYILINAIFSLREKACGLIKRGWCISETLDGKLIHKCLHLICRMSVVSTVSKL